MSTALPDPKGRSDAELISSVREGRIEAYGTLYERHLASAYRLARQLTRSASESDDLVSEAFAKVLDVLRAGKGPDSAFRAYLLTTLRHVAYDKARKDRRIDLTDDITSVAQATDALTVPFTDTAVWGLERSLVAKAFAKLPERWQAVLWHTEIERQSPAEVAPLLGLTPNGVSALAYRAREGLRQAYLQAHLDETAQQRCRATVGRLGAWTRRALSRRERAQVEAHLDRCERCRALAAELADVNSALRAVVAPLVLGGLFASYLATTGADSTVDNPGTASASGGTQDNAGTPPAANSRQFVGVAASGVAMAAAIAIALTAGGPPPPLAQAPPSATRESAPPSTRLPVPEPLPEPPTIAPGPAPTTRQRPVPLPTPTRSGPVETTPPAPAPPAEPAAGPARVVLREQVAELALEADGTPVELPFAVRNEGESPSSPITLTLQLPEGISAVAPGGGGGASGTRAAPAPSGTASDGADVTCPPGEGTVTCARGSLAPGESAVFRLRLRATRDPGSGRITGSLRLGTRLRAPISVPFTVRTADVARLDVEKLLGEWPRALSVELGNDGRFPREAEVTFDRPGLVFPRTSALDCESGTEPRCTSVRPLRPGEVFRVLYVPHRHQHRPLELTVSAKVGRADASATVEFTCEPDRCVGHRDPRQGDPVVPGPTTAGADSRHRPTPRGTFQRSRGHHPFGVLPELWSRPKTQR